MIDMLRTLPAPIEIVTKVLDEGCFVEADAGQFETALVNIAVNPRDAMKSEGQITLQVADRTTCPIRGHAGGPGRFVAVSVTDAGSGVPADRLTQLFRAFFARQRWRGTASRLFQVYGFRGTVGRGRGGGQARVAQHPPSRSTCRVCSCCRRFRGLPPRREA